MIDWDALVVGPCVAVFGQQAPDGSGTPTYMPVTGRPFLINGVFDNGVVPIELNDPSSDIFTTKPVLGCRASDFPAEAAPNDQVFIPSENQTYVVRAVTYDSHGGVLLNLLEHKSHQPGYTPPAAT